MDPTNAELEQQLQEQLQSAPTPIERQSIVELTRGLARLPLDRARAALESAAALAGVSLRASIEFLRAAPGAAQLLEAAALRSWAEMGRRLALADVESAVSFFAAGVDSLQALPPDTHPLVFQLCLRQLPLSSAIGTRTFQ